MINELPGRFLYSLFFSSISNIKGLLVNSALAKVMAGRARIFTARKYDRVARTLCPNVELIFINKEEVEQVKVLLEYDFTGCPNMPGTRKVHDVNVLEEGSVLTKKFYNAKDFNRFNF